MATNAFDEIPDYFDDIPNRAVAEELIIQDEVAADWKAEILSEADPGGGVLISALSAGDWRTSSCGCSCHNSLGGMKHAVACCGFITHSVEEFFQELED